MKTRLRNALPWALPILVLVFVLSGCGKDSKIHALDAPAAPVKATTQGQRANGASDGQLSPIDFASKCTSQFQGRIEANGTICASPVSLQATDLIPSEVGVDQVILPNVPTPDGLYLLIVRGDAPSSTADITLNGAHFMSAGERKLSQHGLLAFYANAKSNSSLSIAAWKCVNNKLVPVNCNLNILQGHQ